MLAMTNTEGHQRKKCKQQLYKMATKQIDFLENHFHEKNWKLKWKSIHPAGKQKAVRCQQIAEIENYTIDGVVP